MIKDVMSCEATNARNDVKKIKRLYIVNGERGNVAVCDERGMQYGG